MFLQKIIYLGHSKPHAIDRAQPKAFAHEDSKEDHLLRKPVISKFEGFFTVSGIILDGCKTECSKYQKAKVDDHTLPGKTTG